MNVPSTSSPLPLAVAPGMASAAFDADGVVSVSIRNLDEGYSRTYDLHGEADEPGHSPG